MRNLMGFNVALTRMDPVEAHVSHLRHLSKTTPLIQVLHERHGYSTVESKAIAESVCPFISQGISFFNAQKGAELRVRPVLQYYSYLNLAVSCVLVFKPAGWQAYKRHGVEDLSRNVTRIGVNSSLLKARKGAVTLFNDIISSAPVPSGKLTLRNLLVPLPMVAAEMESFFNIDPWLLEVTPTITKVDEKWKVRLRYRINAPGSKTSVEGVSFPRKRLHDAVPFLRTDFSLIERKGPLMVFDSNQGWSDGNRARAEKYLENTVIKAVNYGGHQMVESLGRVNLTFSWRFERSGPMMPTLTAGMLLSFALACLSRYRANMLCRVENSGINVLCDVFCEEADGFMMPAFRNMLLGRSTGISQALYT